MNLILPERSPPTRPPPGRSRSPDPGRPPPPGRPDIGRAPWLPRGAARNGHFARNQGAILLLALLAVVVATGPARAAGPEVWVFYRPDIPLYAETFRHLADGTGRNVVPCPVGRTTTSFMESHPPDLVVALGEAGLQRALTVPWPAPIVAVFVDQPPADPRVCLLEAPQPHAQQVALLARLAPTCDTLWYPYAGERFAPGPALQRAAATAGMRIIADRLDDPRGLPQALQHLAHQRTAALLPPDPGLMNTAVVQAILLAAFRSQTPVVGFSEALVKQGAAFAYVLTPEQLAATLADIVDHPPADGRWPKPVRLFSRWSLAINATVIGKLGLALPDEVRAAADRRY